MALATEGFATTIWKNQVKSVILLMGFPFLLLLMIFAFFFLIGVFLQMSTHVQVQDPAQAQDMAKAFHFAMKGIANNGYWALVAAAVWFVIAWFFHTSMIRAACGSLPVTRKQMPKVYNLLENLCISRGMAMPKLEVIDSPALNAFASGINESTYTITLTRGIIEALHDDELETVLGHELTHIRNSDVRLLMVAVIFVGMISFSAHMLGRMLMYGWRPDYYSSDRRNSGSAYVLIMLIALVILAIGYFFAAAIRFSLSRKREFLADAGAIELTKNPEALMRALLRISGHDVVRSMPEQVQQMCIENSAQFMGMFATHPPIEDRLSAISRTTGVEIPTLGVSLKRKPTSPWKEGTAPVHPSMRTPSDIQPLWGFPPDVPPSPPQSGAGQ